jgi:hypothetical protein
MGEHIKTVTVNEFDRMIQNLIKNWVMVKKFNQNFPSLPKIFRKNKDGVIYIKELKLPSGKPNRGHTMSVITGYKGRVRNFNSKLI